MQVKTATSGSLPPKGELLPRCRLCEEVPLQGIRGGFLIGGMFICRKCEAMIIRLQVGTREYEDVLRKIRKLWE